MLGVPLPSDGAALLGELGQTERVPLPAYTDGSTVSAEAYVPLSLEELQRSLSHIGPLERLRCLIQRIRGGENVTIGVIGGSISAGSSSAVRPDQTGLFHKKFQLWLQQRLASGTVHHFNAAMPAIPPTYMEHCLDLHVPQNADLVFLEVVAGPAAQMSQALLLIKRGGVHASIG
eukprot:2398067-Pleurochrysis_carterae.AAC.5